MHAYDGIGTSLLCPWYRRTFNGPAYSRSRADCRIATGLPVMFPPSAFLGGPASFAVVMLLWGMGFDAPESAMRTAIIQQFPPARRASAFGAFHAVFGVLWLFGSLALGAAYDYAMWAVVLISVALQVLGLPFLAAARSLTTTKETFA